MTYHSALAAITIAFLAPAAGGCDDPDDKGTSDSAADMGDANDDVHRWRTRRVGLDGMRELGGLLVRRAIQRRRT